MTSLKKHLAISHKIKFQGGIKFDAAKHATGNLPQCAYCGHKFGEWYGLRMHIERVNCPKLMLGQMQAKPPRATPLTAQEDPQIVRILEEKRLEVAVGYAPSATFCTALLPLQSMGEGSKRREKASITGSRSAVEASGLPA